MTPVQRETLNRMTVLTWAYAYEVKQESLVPDWVYDKTCLEIDVNMDTGDAVLDAWFREHFDPSTGMWIFHLPEPYRAKVESRYNDWMESRHVH